MSLPFTSPHFLAHRGKESPLIYLSSPILYLPYHLLPALLTCFPLPKQPRDFSHTRLHLCRAFLFLNPLSCSSQAAFSPFVDFKTVCPSPLESFWFCMVVFYVCVSPLTGCELLQSRGPLSCSSLHCPYCLTQSQHPRRGAKQ